jgi:hypothetical protein
VWDIDFGRQFGNLGASLSFSNLTGTQYEEVKGITMPGRAVIFGAEFMIARKIRQR